MKKIFVVLIMLLSVFGCTKTEPETVEIKYLDMPSVYKADMSDYPGMKAFDHNFIGVSAEELLNARRNGGSGLFYLGYNDCHYCREAVRYLNEVAKENEMTIFYIDCYAEEPDYFPYHEDFLKEFEDILSKNEKGETSLFTPEIIAIINGTVKGHSKGLPDDWDMGNPTEKQIKNLKKEYQNLFNYFK